jgi:hypothetical protein
MVRTQGTAAVKIHYINRVVLWTSGGSDVVFACGRMQQIVTLRTTMTRDETTCLACRKMMGMT